MPNWCTNTAIIMGQTNSLIDFVDTIESHRRLFSPFLPIPNELQETNSPPRDDEVAKNNIEKYGFKDWYDWAIVKWGTKWDVNIENIVTDFSKYETDDNISVVKLFFDTAWSPPLAAIKYISTLYPDCVFSITYDEPGICFYGWHIYVNGEDVSNIDINCSVQIEIGNLLGNKIDHLWAWLPT